MINNLTQDEKKRVKYCKNVRKDSISSLFFRFGTFLNIKNFHLKKRGLSWTDDI